MIEEKLEMEAIPIFELIGGNEQDDDIVQIGRVIGYRLVKACGSIQDKSHMIIINVGCNNNKTVKTIMDALDGIAVQMK